MTRRSRSASLGRSIVAGSPASRSSGSTTRRGAIGGSLRARLTAAFSGVALLSTALTLGFHDRELRRDLETAAVARLETSAEAVRLLAERHLGALAARYAAASSSRWLRDLMERSDRPALDDFADRIRARNSAARILFVNPEQEVIGRAGERFPEDRLASMRGQKLLEHDGAAYAAVSVPIRSGDRTLGRILAVEPVGSQTVSAWSKLCGARVLSGICHTSTCLPRSTGTGWRCRPDISCSRRTGRASSASL